jgi:two-component system NtrC family sensor kinase
MNDMIDILLYVSLALVLVLFVVQTVRLGRKDRHLGALSESSEFQDRMATMGQLLAGIAHELKTPLGAVTCSLDTTRRALGKIGEALDGLEASSLHTPAREELAKAQKALKIIRSNEPILEQALERTGLLVRQLRLSGRGDKADAERVDVNELVKGSLILMTHELKKEVAVNLELGQVPPVTGWMGPLGQVFLNLILNAEQAIEGPGRITIFSGVENGQVVVRVSDTGSGLGDVCPDTLFEPGWTTKPKDQGTGLGLHISRKIVERHEGRIEARNGDSGGAVFEVILPPAAEGNPEADV